MLPTLRTVVVAILGLVFSVISVAQADQAAQDSNSNARQSQATRPGRTEDASDPTQTVQLGAGDLLAVSVYNVPELTTRARVGSNGNVYLPLIDYVHVADLSIEEAQTVIAKRLSDRGFVKDPHVTIFVDEYTSQGAAVLGEVAKPGTYPVLGPKKLFDLISAAGGITERAGGSVTISHRNAPEHTVTLPLTQDLAASAPSNVAISAGDTIVVRRADVIYVVGDVVRPSGFMMSNGRLSVLQAIALAGGPTRTSKLSKARIIHKGANGMQEDDIQLNKILRARAPDVAMAADDILFVPSSSAKIATSRAVDTAMSMASALTIVAVHP